MPYQFKEEDALITESMKWENVGDKIQGTLIKKKQIRDKYNKIIWMYDILLEDGSVKSVWGKEVEKNSFFDSQMAIIPLGRIVEIRFVGLGEPQPGKNPAKYLKIFSRKDLFNKKWLEEQEQTSTIDNVNEVEDMNASEVEVKEDDGEIKIEEAPFKDTPEPVAGTISAQNTEIEKLAIEKLRLVAGADIQKAVMEATGIAYIHNNLAKILESLKKM